MSNLCFLWQPISPAEAWTTNASQARASQLPVSKPVKTTPFNSSSNALQEQQPLKRARDTNNDILNTIMGQRSFLASMEKDLFKPNNNNPVPIENMFARMFPTKQSPTTSLGKTQ